MKQTEFLIRHIEHQDAIDLVELIRQMGSNLSITEFRSQIERITEDSNHCILVAEMDERIVGYIHGFISLRLTSNPFLEIGGLIVDPKHRKQGIARSLIKHLESRFPDYSMTRVRCNFKREQAHAFYLGLNFTEVKQQKIFERSV